jgi:hypothetical protein
MSTTEDGADTPGGPTRGDAAKETARIALATGATYAEAGRRAGVSERTIARWMSNPAFARSVSEKRSEHMNVGSGRLAAVVPDAVAVLITVMTTGTTAEQLKAAQIVLAWALRLRRDSDFEQRLLETEVLLGVRDRDLAPQVSDQKEEGV